MLHPFDDYPLHQTPEPFLHVGGGSPNAYDRFFYNGFDDDGSVFFALAFGVYPNRRVMDAAFSVVRHGVQHNVRGSRRCPDDRTATTVSPVQVIVDEPMRRHRLLVEDRFGLSAELHWESISPAIEEPRFTRVEHGRTLFDYTRLTQFGSWTGWIDIDGERTEFGTSPADGATADGTTSPVVGVRDRSWGVRPVGARPAGPASLPQFYWLWAPTVFDDACTHLALNHDGGGLPWHQSGAVTARLGDGDDPLDPSLIQRATGAAVDLRWGKGTRWAETADARLSVWRAEPVEVSYEPILRFQMSGIGYGHPQWGHGHWVGEAEATRDEIDLDAVDPENPTAVHIQALSKARWGDRTGTGVVEQLAIGAHEPTGLHGLATGADG